MSNSKQKKNIFQENVLLGVNDCHLSNMFVIDIYIYLYRKRKISLFFFKYYSVIQINDMMHIGLMNGDNINGQVENILY
jgi:hypothetical protein